MKKIVLLSIVASMALAEEIPGWSGREYQVKRHNINQIEMCISNYGKFGQSETDGGGLWWPKGSAHTYLYGAGVWFGTIDSVTDDTLVTIGYGPSGGQSEFACGLTGMPVTHPDAIIFMYPDEWPPPDSTYPMAPYIPVSHQDSWCCFNDSDTTRHMPGDTRPIGIEVYQTVYAWDEPFIEDVIFMTYDVKNVSGNNLKACYVGICVACDFALDNGISTAILEKPYLVDGNLYIVDNLAYSYTYNDTFACIGAIGFDLLQTPFDLEIGQDKDNDGIPDQYERDSAYYWNTVPQNKWDVDNDGVPDWRDASENPQLGMTAFKKFTLDLEPAKDNERYATLAGYNFKTGQYEPYDTLDSCPGDQRFLISAGPFDLDVDSVMKFSFAIVLAHYGADATPPAETCLVITDHWAQWQYDMNWFLNVNEQSSHEAYTTGLVASPNPAVRSTQVHFSLPRQCPVSLRLYNAAGQLIRGFLDTNMNAGSHSEIVNTCGLANGTYILVLETPYSTTSQSLVIVR